MRLVSAVAATACEVLEITQRDFVRLQPQKPQACLKLALAIAQDLAHGWRDNRDAAPRARGEEAGGPLTVRPLVRRGTGSDGGRAPFRDRARATSANDVTPARAT